MSQLTQTFVDSNGVALAGAKVYTYESGTSTPLTTYQDQLGATPNANPVILDASGQANIWLQNQPYKIVIEDSADNLLATGPHVTHMKFGGRGWPSGHTKVLWLRDIRFSWWRGEAVHGADGIYVWVKKTES